MTATCTNIPISLFEAELAFIMLGGALVISVGIIHGYRKYKKTVEQESTA